MVSNHQFFKFVLMVEIKKCNSNDLQLLQQFSIKTFTETFGADNPKEDIEAYLKKSLSLEKLQAEMACAGSDFYFLQSATDLIGYLKLNFAPFQSDINDPESLEIERIYVDHSFHGKGYGKVLFDFALKQAHQKKLKYIWLGVWERNFKAIDFYKQHGFVKFAEHPFKLGSELQRDHLMRLDISA